MWVKVFTIDKENNNYEGILDNDPTKVRIVKIGESIKFHKEDILDVTR